MKINKLKYLDYSPAVSSTNLDYEFFLYLCTTRYGAIALHTSAPFRPSVLLGYMEIFLFITSIAKSSRQRQDSPVVPKHSAQLIIWSTLRHQRKSKNMRRLTLQIVWCSIKFPNNHHTMLITHYQRVSYHATVLLLHPRVKIRL